MCTIAISFWTLSFASFITHKSNLKSTRGGEGLLRGTHSFIYSSIHLAVYSVVSRKADRMGRWSHGCRTGWGSAHCSFRSKVPCENAIPSERLSPTSAEISWLTWEDSVGMRRGQVQVHGLQGRRKLSCRGQARETHSLSLSTWLLSHPVPRLLREKISWVWFPMKTLRS